MKLRIENNQIRFRLKKSEVKHLLQETHLSNELTIGKTIFQYSLILYCESKIEIEYLDQEISVFIPQKQALNWMNTELVSLSSNHNQTRILIEKDFKCTSNFCDESIEHSDFYENPKK